MNTAIRAISLRLAGAATALLLSGCATLSPLSDVIIPNFSDENLGNPMAGYTPAGAVGTPVVNRGAPSAAAVTAASVPRRTGPSAHTQGPPRAHGKTTDASPSAKPRQRPRELDI